MYGVIVKLCTLTNIAIMTRLFTDHCKPLIITVAVINSLSLLFACTSYTK